MLGGHDNYQPHYASEEDKVPDARAPAETLPWCGMVPALMCLFRQEQSKEIEGHNLASVECFIPESNRWEQLAPMLVTRSSVCCVALDDGYSA